MIDWVLEIYLSFRLFSHICMREIRLYIISTEENLDRKINLRLGFDGNIIGIESTTSFLFNSNKENWWGQGPHPPPPRIPRK